jgi:hypothetical protein
LLRIRIKGRNGRGRCGSCSGKRSHGGGEAGAALGGGSLLWPEVGDEAGSWAAWAKRGAARCAGVVSVLAGRQAKAQGGGGQWGGPICGKMEKSIPNLIFGLTKILEIKSRSF